MTGSLEFFNYRGRCIYCDMIQQELATEKRIVLDTPDFVAFCPFASRFPVRDLDPAQDARQPLREHPARRRRRAGPRAASACLAKIEAALDRPAYNYIIHTAPFDTQALRHYHWHIEIIPRLTKTAGFEWGTGFYINPVPPEEAAAFLRDVEAPYTRRARNSDRGRLDKWRARLPINSLHT